MAGNKKIEENNSMQGFNRVLNFDFSISKDKIPKFIPFILFISVLVIFYIANKYYAEKALIERDKLKRELKDLRAESLTIKAELVNKTKRSEVARMTKEFGLKELKEPPKKIEKEDIEY